MECTACDDSGQESVIFAHERFDRVQERTGFLSGVLCEVGFDLLLEIGMDTVEDRVLSLSQRLAEGLSARGYELLGSRRPGEASGIVAFRADGIPSTEVARALTAATVQLTQRAGTVRLSPHVYNTEDEIDSVLAALPQL